MFKRYPDPSRSHLSFSLIYAEEGEARTLDLTCDSERDFEYWYFGLQVRFDVQPLQRSAKARVLPREWPEAGGRCV